MMYPLVREMTAPNAPLRVPVAVPCAGYWVSPSRGTTSGAHSRFLLASRKRNTLIEVVHELHEDDPEGGYRVLADNAPRSGLPDLGASRVAGVSRCGDLLEDHQPQTQVP